MGNIYHAKSLKITVNGESVGVKVRNLPLSGTVTGKARLCGKYSKIYSRKKRIREKYRKKLAAAFGLPYQYPRKSYFKKVRLFADSMFPDVNSLMVDNYAAYYGIKRERGESNDALIKRVLNAIKSCSPRPGEME